MVEVAKALYSFFSSFGVKAYAETRVPDGAELPYISYELIQSDWKRSTLMHVSLWDRESSVAELNHRVDLISHAIGEGKLLRTENGCVMLAKGTPFARHYATENNVRRVILNLVVQTNVF